MLIGKAACDPSVSWQILVIVKNIQSNMSPMRPDKTQSGIDALKILANAVNNGSDVHIRRNGDVRGKRFDEKILNHLGIKKTPKDWEISAKNRVKEKISADLKLLNRDTSIGRKPVSDEQIHEFIETYLKNVKSRTPNQPVIDKKFRNLNDELLSLSEIIHGKNTANFRASLRLSGGSTTAAAQITMFANDLKKRWGLNSGHALTAGFQIWHLCSKNHDMKPEEAFHIAMTAGNLVKKQILQPPKNREELKSNLDAAAEIIQASRALKESHNSPDPLAHACQRFLAREQLASALPAGMRPNLIEGKPVKNRYDFSQELKDDFIKSIAESKIMDNEIEKTLGVTKQFRRECIGNPFKFTFPDLAAKDKTSSSMSILYSGLNKKITHKKSIEPARSTESLIRNIEERQSDIPKSLEKLAECSAQLLGQPKKSAAIKLSASRIFEQASLNHIVNLASSASATNNGDYFLFTHGISKYPIAQENSKLTAILQSASVDDKGNLTQELIYFSRIYSIRADNNHEIPVNRHINPVKPIDPEDPTTYSSKVFFKMKYLASDLALGKTKPEIQEAYVEHSFDMSSSVMESL